MRFPTLYGRATNGKVKEWTVSVSKMGDGSCFIETEHGYSDGKKQLDQRLVDSGKNIGKSNETTPYEQACSEAKSAFLKKVDSGYVEDRSEIPKDSDGLFLPMLAHSWDKHSKKISYPCWTQPKLDGMRMLAKKESGKVVLWSRKGKVIETLPLIAEQLAEILDEGQSVDGEVYVHGWTFQRIISAVKKHSDDTDLLEYHIYDSPHETLEFEKRIPLNSDEAIIFPEYCAGWQSFGTRIKFVKSTKCLTEADLLEAEARAIEDGYEGLMARNSGSLYKFKNRSFDLQKVKRFIDSEFKIIGGKDGSGREAGLVIFRCVTDDGLEFDVRPRGSQEERAEIFKNLSSYIDKPLTVRYQEMTDDGRPRFPVGIAVRDYE